MSETLSKQYDLQGLMSAVRMGKIGLPDIQRGVRGTHTMVRGTHTIIRRAGSIGSGLAVQHPEGLR